MELKFEPSEALKNFEERQNKRDLKELHKSRKMAKCSHCKKYLLELQDVITDDDGIGKSVFKCLNCGRTIKFWGDK
ncbi:MAG: hypothetical protein GY861_01110 [bacterium]|nr:hypothetical protein [bacterium]